MGKVVKKVVKGVIVAGALVLATTPVGPFISPGLAALIIGAGAGIALGEISGLLNKVLGPSLADQQGLKEEIRSAVAPRILVYGRTSLAGTMVYAGTSGTDNKFLTMIFVVAGHEIDAFEKFYFNDDLLTLDGSGNVTAPARYVGKAIIKTALGTSTQAAITGVAPAEWTTNHRLRGLAYYMVRLEADPDAFPNGRPQVRAVIRGAKLLDVRTSVTEWSLNPALILRDYLTRDPLGARLPTTDIDDTAIIAAANVCDEDVGLKAGGTQKRYEASGLMDTRRARNDNIAAVLSAMGGFLVYQGARFTAYAGADSEFAPATVTFDENDLRGGISVATRLPRTSRINRVRGQFIDPANDLFEATDYPPVIDAAAETADGGEVLEQSLDLPFTTDGIRAQRLARLALGEARREITVSLPVNLKGLQVQALSTVKVTNARLGWTNKLFRVAGWQLSADGGVDLDLKEYDPAIYSWTPATDELALTSPATPTIETGTTAPAVAGLTAVAGVTTGPNGTKTPVIDVSFTAPTALVQSTLIQMREAGGAWRMAGVVTDFSTPSRQLTGLEPGQTYEVRAAHITRFGVTGAFASVTGIAIAAASRTADDVVSVNAVPASDVAGQALAPSQNLLGPDAGPERTGITSTTLYLDSNVVGSLDAMGIIPGTTVLSGGVWVKTDGTAGEWAQWNIRFRDAAGAIINPDRAAIGTQATTVYELLTLENILVPANAARLIVFVQQNGASGTAIAKQAMLNPGPKMLSFTEPPLRATRETASDLKYADQVTTLEALKPAQAGAQVNPPNLAALDPAQDAKLVGVAPGAEVNPANLAALDPTQDAKLVGIAAGAQVNPPDLATLDPTQDAKLVGIAAGADVSGDTLRGGLLPNWTLDIVDGEGKPAGIRGVQGAADRTGVMFGDAGKTFMRLSSADASIGYGFPAIPIDDKQTYELTVRHKSSVTSVTGLFLAFQELAASLPVGTTHVGTNDGETIAAIRTSSVSVVSNGPAPGLAWRDDTYTYTPTPGTKYATFSILRWIGFSGDYDLDSAQLRPVINEAKIDALALINAPAQAGADVTGDTLRAGLLPNWTLDIADSAGKPAGIKATQGIVGEGQVQFGGIGVQILGSPDSSVEYGFPAIPIDDKQQYEITVRHKSSAASASGLWITAAELNTALPAGKTHIGTVLSSVMAARSSAVGLVSDGAMPGTAAVENTYTYTPTPGAKFMSLNLANWTPFTGTYELAFVQMRPVINEAAITSGDTSKVAGVAALTVKDGAAKADLGLTATGTVAPGKVVASSIGSSVNISEFQNITAFGAVVTTGFVEVAAIAAVVIAGHKLSIAFSFTAGSGATANSQLRLRRDPGGANDLVLWTETYSAGNKISRTIVENTEPNGTFKYALEAKDANAADQFYTSSLSDITLSINGAP